MGHFNNNDQTRLLFSSFPFPHAFTTKHASCLLSLQPTRALLACLPPINQSRDSTASIRATMRWAWSWFDGSTFLTVARSPRTKTKLKVLLVLDVLLSGRQMFATTYAFLGCLGCVDVRIARARLCVALWMSAHLLPAHGRGVGPRLRCGCRARTRRSASNLRHPRG